jgi:hypothetical protein
LVNMLAHGGVLVNMLAHDGVMVNMLSHVGIALFSRTTDDRTQDFLQSYANILTTTPW